MKRTLSLPATVLGWILTATGAGTFGVAHQGVKQLPSRRVEMEKKGEADVTTDVDVQTDVDVCVIKFNTSCKKVSMWVSNAPKFPYTKVLDDKLCSSSLTNDLATPWVHTTITLFLQVGYFL